MGGYKAKFIGGLGAKPGIKMTLTLCVSMGYVQQTGEQFAAFLGLVIKNNRNISQLQIVVSDDLYRHYYGWTPSMPDEARRTMADRAYSEWIDENWKPLSFFKDVDGILVAKAETSVASMTVREANVAFGISLAELQYARATEFKIIRWRTLVETPEYSAAKMEVDKAFTEIPEFKSIVEEVAKPHCAKGHTLASVIEFLKEEIAVVAGPLKEREIAYPSTSFNAAVIWALRNIFCKEVAYHGYSVEPRGKQPTLAQFGIPGSNIVSSEDQLRTYTKMLSVVAQNAKAAEVEVNTKTGVMRFRFEYGSSASRERSGSLKWRPEAEAILPDLRHGSSPK